MTPAAPPPKLRVVGPAQWQDVDPEWESRRLAEKARAEPYRQAIGVDLGYSENAGDYASIIPVAAMGVRFYVRDLVRCRRDVIHLRAIIASVQRQYPGAQLVSYINGPEKAVLALLNEDHVDERNGAKMPGVNIMPMLARFPKPVRSQATAEIWNEGRVVVPPTRPWTGEFVERMKNFTGAAGNDDADTDALVSAVDYLIQTAPSGVATTGAYRRTRA